MSLKKSSNTIHYSAGDRVFLAADALILGLVFLLVLYPLLFVMSSSFSGGSEISSLSLIPDQFSLEGYKAAVEYDYFWGSYWNSAVYTAVGTLVAMVVTILCAYPLSQQNFRAGKIAMGLCVFTMYFSGGLIPTYLWIRTLGLMNSPWAFLLPSALNIYNMIVMRTYFVSLPEDIREAAQIDGCGEWRYLVQIVLPLSSAVLAVVALYYGVARWNAYFDSMIYLQDRSKLPLQNILPGDYDCQYQQSGVQQRRSAGGRRKAGGASEVLHDRHRLDSHAGFVSLCTEILCQGRYDRRCEGLNPEKEDFYGFDLILKRSPGALPCGGGRHRRRRGGAVPPPFRRRGMARIRC